VESDDQPFQDAIAALTDNERETLARQVWGYIAPPVNGGRFAQARIAELRDGRDISLTADLDELTPEELHDLSHLHLVLSDPQIRASDWFTLGVNLYLMVFAGRLNDELRRRDAHVLDEPTDPR
jgi:hypothetical protein